jgi:hypothetical protein
MSFLKDTKSVLTDLKDERKLEHNLRRIEQDEMVVIRKIKEYDRKIEAVQKKFSMKSRELGLVMKAVFKARPKSKAFKDLLLKKKRVQKEQHELLFSEEASLRHKQSELVAYYRDLALAIKLLTQMKKLRKSQSSKVYDTIIRIKRHLQN